MTALKETRGSHHPESRKTDLPSPQMALSSARRVVLLSYNSTTRTVDFRHFVIQVRPVGVSKPIRKLIAGSTNNKVGSGLRAQLAQGSEESEASEAEEGEAVVARPRPIPTKTAATTRAKGVLDLSRADDISDYILRQEQMGFVTSDSEMSDMSDAEGAGSTRGVGSMSGGSDSEQDEKRGKVRLAADYVGRGNRGRGVRGEKRAVRLVELGPRMELGLVKIEEGIGEGEVLFHEMGASLFSFTGMLRGARETDAQTSVQSTRRTARRPNSRKCTPRGANSPPNVAPNRKPTSPRRRRPCPPRASLRPRRTTRRTTSWNRKWMMKRPR